MKFLNLSLHSTVIKRLFCSYNKKVLWFSNLFQYFIYYTVGLITEYNYVWMTNIYNKCFIKEQFIKLCDYYYFRLSYVFSHLVVVFWVMKSRFDNGSSIFRFLLLIFFFFVNNIWLIKIFYRTFDHFVTFNCIDTHSLAKIFIKNVLMSLSFFNLIL